MISHEELLRQLTYDPKTGLFERRFGRRHTHHRNRGGYVVIGVNYRTYYAHRLAWFYMFGEWPTLVIDHINGDRSDNRISNLRLANMSQNVINSSVTWGMTGKRGVFRQANTKKYRVRLSLNGIKNIHIGYFATKEEAARARNDAVREAYGQYARDV